MSNYLHTYTGKIQYLYPDARGTIGIEYEDGTSEEFQARNKVVEDQMSTAKLQVGDIVKLEVSMDYWEYVSFEVIPEPTLEDRVTALEELVKELRSALGADKMRPW